MKKLSGLILICFLFISNYNKAQQKDTSIKYQQQSKAFTPKFCINLNYGRLIPFGDFSNTSFGNAGSQEEFERYGYTKGGMAANSPAINISVGVKIKKNWGVVGQLFYSQLLYDTRSIKRELLKIFPDRDWELSKFWGDLVVASVGYFSRNKLGKTKRFFYEHRGSIGVSFTQPPILTLESNKFFPVSGNIKYKYALNVPSSDAENYDGMNYWGDGKSATSLAVIGGGSFGYAPTKFLAIMVGGDVIVSRAVFEDYFMGSAFHFINPKRTIEQFITAFTPHVQLSFMF